MPKSFLVKMRSTSDVPTSAEAPRDNHIGPETSSNLERRTLKHQQLMHTDSLTRREILERTPHRLPTEGRVTQLITPQPRRYPPTMAPYPLPGYPMTSQHHLLPRYIAWSPVGLLPRHEFMYSPHASSSFPRIIRERRQTWEYATPNFSEFQQRRWSAGGVSPQAQFPGNVQGKLHEYNVVGRPPSFLQSPDCRKEAVNKKQSFKEAGEKGEPFKEPGHEREPFKKPGNKRQTFKEPTNERQTESGNERQPFIEAGNERQPFKEREADWRPIIKDFFSIEDVSCSKSPKNEEKRQREGSVSSLFKRLDHCHELAGKNFKKTAPVCKELRKADEVESVFKTETVTTSLLAPSQESLRNEAAPIAIIEGPTHLGTQPAKEEGGKPHKCEECGKGFKQRGNLTRHVTTHLTDKQHICTHCNKSFNRLSNLHTHIKTHSDHKAYTCDFCGKGFHQKIDKRIHSYTHTGEKPYKCQKCGRGFKQLTHLNYHMRTHSNEHMYHCTYCGKGFNQKGNLQAHIYKHTGERPFKCEACGKGFTLRSTLNTHLRTHATKKPFACQYCDKAFYQKNALKMHHIASHPIMDGKSIL